MNLRIFPPEEMIETTVQLPMSKSMIVRLLIINALAGADNDIPEAGECDDTAVVSNALNAGEGASLDLKDSGAALRLLTAYFAATPGRTVTLDGSDRLRQRPLKQLTDALTQVGADIRFLDKEGHAPLRISGRQLTGGDITIDATVSSQFVSALMLVGPTMSAPLTIHLDGEAVSRPYILMTDSLMKARGADVEVDGQTVLVRPSAYNTVTLPLERDWTAASYWYAVTALSAGFITLPDLKLDSVQGDRACARLFEMLGVNTEPAENTDGLDLMASPEQFSRFEVDLSDNPDLTQTVAVVAAMLGIPFHLTGLSTLCDKETDRLEALRKELLKFGIIAELRGNSQIVWNGQRHPIFQLPVIDSCGDHRMAMSFAAAALYVPGIVIERAEVVAKSYPRFWEDLRNAGFTIVDADQEPENSEETQ